MSSTFSDLASPRFLRRLLWANALFSATSAGVLLTWTAPLARMLGMTVPQLVQLGWSLAVFCALLAFLASRADLQRPAVLWAVVGIAVADLLWVLGSMAALATGLAEATTTGRWLVVAVAVVVGDFGALEGWLWHRLRPERKAS